MIHSYSSLADWKLCPRMHKRRYIDKDPRFKFQKTAASERGDRLHAAMEDCLEKGAPPPSEWKGKPGLLELMRKYGARAEVKVAMTRDGRGCEFFDNKSAWIRGKLDVYLPIIPQKAAILVDWKSGNPNYTDPLQAKVYGAMLSCSTSLEDFLFIWGYFSGETPFERVNGAEALIEVRQLAERVEADKLHTPRPSWKCRFCADTDCEYNRLGE